MLGLKLFFLFATLYFAICFYGEVRSGDYHKALLSLGVTILCFTEFKK